MLDNLKDKIFGPDGILSNIDLANLTSNKLEIIKSSILGKAGLITEALQQVNPADRKAQYTIINEIKEKVQLALQELNSALDQVVIETMLQEEHNIDRPRNCFSGSLHPLQALISQISELLDGMGFISVPGTHIELITQNFDGLNVGPYHPSRSQSDTFYIDDKFLLRPHTTASLEGKFPLKPPFNAYCIGPVYRNEAEDSTHTCMFHQMDVVVMSQPGQQFSLKDLRGLVNTIIFSILGPQEWSWIPSYFPFTEPSMEVYINDLEILGCGLLHPKILQNQGLENHSCLAMGIGLERILSIKHGIANIRELYNFDARSFFMELK